MRDVSKCNETKAFPADEARSSGPSRAEWVEGVCVASHLLDETREESELTQTLSTGQLRRTDAFFFFFFQRLNMTATLTMSMHTHAATAD